MKTTDRINGATRNSQGEREGRKEVKNMKGHAQTEDVAEKKKQIRK